MGLRPHGSDVFSYLASRLPVHPTRAHTPSHRRMYVQVHFGVLVRAPRLHPRRRGHLQLFFSSPFPSLMPASQKKSNSGAMERERRRKTSLTSCRKQSGQGTRGGQEGQEASKQEKRTSEERGGVRRGNARNSRGVHTGEKKKMESEKGAAHEVCAFIPFFCVRVFAFFPAVRLVSIIVQARTSPSLVCFTPCPSGQQKYRGCDFTTTTEKRGVERGGRGVGRRGDQGEKRHHVGRTNISTRCTQTETATEEDTQKRT